MNNKSAFFNPKNIIILLTTALCLDSFNISANEYSSEENLTSAKSNLIRQRAIPQKAVKASQAIATSQSSPIRARKKGKNIGSEADANSTNALGARKLARQTTRQVKKAKRRVVGR